MKMVDKRSVLIIIFIIKNMSIFERALLRAKGYSKEDVQRNERGKVKIAALENEVRRLEGAVSMNKGHEGTRESIDVQNQLNKVKEELRQTRDLNKSFNLDI